MSRPSRQKSWQTGRERVSVLAALAIQKDTVSRVLLELREQHKPPGSDRPLSQERAAGRAGVTGRQWQRWESGESEPYLRNLEAVASAFGVPVARFLDMDERDGATTSILSLEDIREEFRVDVDEVKTKLDENRERLDEILAKLAGPEFANALEASEDQPAPGDARREEPARDEDGRDSRDSA